MGKCMFAFVYLLVHTYMNALGIATKTLKYCARPDTEMTSYSYSETMDSVITCGIACQQSDDCESFSYGTSTEVCKLHDIDPLNTPNKIVQSYGRTLYHNPGCASGWDMYGGMCYLFSTLQGNWEYSKKYCESKNSYLVIVDTENEHEFIRSVLRRKGQLYYWIGARYNETSGDYSWIDGTEVTFDGWGDGKKPDSPSRCIDYLYSNGWLWNRALCSTSYCNFICEKEFCQ